MQCMVCCTVLSVEPLYNRHFGTEKHAVCYIQRFPLYIAIIIIIIYISDPQKLCSREISLLGGFVNEGSTVYGKELENQSIYYLCEPIIERIST